MMFVGIIMCLVSGYGIAQNLAEKYLLRVILSGERIYGIKNIAIADAILREHTEKEGRLYYFYNLANNQLWAEYCLKQPQISNEKVIEIKMELYKMDGEAVYKDQLEEIYKTIVIKYNSFKDAKERTLSWIDFLEMENEELEISF